MKPNEERKFKDDLLCHAGQPFHFDFEKCDIGHTVVIGSPGSGKSIVPVTYHLRRADGVFTAVVLDPLCEKPSGKILQLIADEAEWLRAHGFQVE